MRVPRATYRLQLRRGFGFAEARELSGYLDDLGISDLYLSPIFQARAGSEHCYDVTDPGALNRELGSPEEFDELSRELAHRGMGLLLDIVPNHMAASPENPWWRDLLEHGQGSPAAKFFDVDWNPAWPALRGRVLLPILAQPYGQALYDGQIRLQYREGGFYIAYMQMVLPLDPRTYRTILQFRPNALKEMHGADSEAFHRLSELADAFGRLSPTRMTRPGGRMLRQRTSAALKSQLHALCETRQGIRHFIDESLRIINGTPGEPDSFGRLERLLAAQPYWLAFWQTALEEVNYQRFFDISDLARVRVEEPDVFRQTHELLLRLIAERKITGVRIDHVDGLLDPRDYLRRLAAAIESPFFIIVEKILAPDESLPGDWPVAGTTGYDFLNATNALFVDPRGYQALTSFHARFTGDARRFDEVEFERKLFVAECSFGGEMRSLAQALARLAEREPEARDLAPRILSRTLAQVTAALDVYRTYIRDGKVSAEDRQRVRQAVHLARRRDPGVPEAAYSFLENLLLRESKAPARAKPAPGLRFVMRWQQLTGPVMAKGFEDTALYVFNPLVSLNEVGGQPGAGGMSAAEFHRFIQGRASQSPAALNASSTHDTKRGEDVRARINVLSELADEWTGAVRRWRRMNRRHKMRLSGRLAPDANMESLIYQTLIGAWPLYDRELPAFLDRLDAYLVKAAREAKTHTSWLEPDEEYERAIVRFARRIIEAKSPNVFLDEFLQIHEQTAVPGAVNSLAQLLLKIAAPGVPDFYQGTELWSLNLVDPDNRRPVDFRTRQQMLQDLRHPPARRSQVLQELLLNWRDARIKLFVTAEALRFRAAEPELFQHGDYIPLNVEGRHAAHVIALARRHANAHAIVVVPIRVACFAAPVRFPLGESAWDDTRIILPAGFPNDWEEILSNQRLATETAGLPSSTGDADPHPDEAPRCVRLATLLQDLPVALLHGRTLLYEKGCGPRCQDRL